jgi:hypothetical protein
MDENPYKAPDKHGWAAPTKPRQHPMLDPVWNRVAWAVLLMPFLVLFVTVLARWFFSLADPAPQQ